MKGAPVSSFHDVDDKELARRFVAGDELAFVEIVRRHRPAVAAIALHTLRNRSDAEEITQDVFIRAHRGLANFRGESAVKTWLCMITMNLCRNRYWYWRRRRRHVTDSLEFPIGDKVGSTVADLIACDKPLPTDEAELSELSAVVDAGMERLSPRYREILTLRNVLQRSHEEIAESLGLNVGTVKSRISRARSALRASISHELPKYAAQEAAS